MDSCDVLIVGGGPAGSSCAWGLRNSGLDVVVLDRQNFPRDKVCGGWITPPILQELSIDPAEYARGRVFQPITAFRIGLVGGSTVETTFGEPVSYGIRRREFDDYLLRRSRARLVLGTALGSLERSADGWIANRSIHARMVVGAGGHFCPVARLLGAKTGGEPAVVAQESEFEMGPRQIEGCKIQGDTPELYFCSDLLGYGWCFRKGNFLNVGLGRADAHELGRHVLEFLDFLKSAGRISFEIPAPRGHAYLLHGTSNRMTVDDGVLLIGDAAGLAHPMSGEGIRPAVESGLRAAQTILAAEGFYARSRLEPALAPPPPPSWLQRLLPVQLLASLLRQLLCTRWFVRRVVIGEWFLRT